MRIQDFVIADISNFLNEYSKNITRVSFVEGKATIIVDNLPKTAYNDIRDIALENEFKCDIVHDSIMLY